MALLTGITLDLIVGRATCISPIIFSIVAIIAGYFDKNFSKDNKITIMIMVVGMTIVCEIVNYFLNVAILESLIELKSFIRILLIETLYNAILTIIFYGAIIKLGYKQKNILTRYF